MNILVAVDGSANSQAAIDAVLGMNWPEGTEIKLFSVVKGGEFFGIAAGHSHDEAMEAVRVALKSMADELKETLKQCDITFEVVHGDARHQIVEQAKHWDAHLIIMGSRGNKGLDLMLLGSVSQGVLMQASCPVLVVKYDAEREDQELQSGFQNVLITLDNSPYSRAALAWVKKMYWGPKTRFKLVTIVPSMTESMSEHETGAAASGVMHKQDALKVMARREMESMGQELREVFGDRVTLQVGEGDPRETILHIAEAWLADLIVLGSHGRTGLNKLLLGSVSQAVAQHSTTSVAVVRGVVPPGQAGLKQTGMFQMPDIKKVVEEPVLPKKREQDESPHIHPGGMM